MGGAMILRLGRAGGLCLKLWPVLLSKEWRAASKASVQAGHAVAVSEGVCACVCASVSVHLSLPTLALQPKLARARDFRACWACFQVDGIGGVFAGCVVSSCEAKARSRGGFRDGWIYFPNPKPVGWDPSPRGIFASLSPSKRPMS